MWKLIDKTTVLSARNDTASTPQNLMKGKKIRMKQFLRTQLLKTRHAYSSAISQNNSFNNQPQINLQFIVNNDTPTLFNQIRTQRVNKSVNQNQISSNNQNNFNDQSFQENQLFQLFLDKPRTCNDSFNPRNKYKWMKTSKNFNNINIRKTQSDGNQNFIITTQRTARQSEKSSRRNIFTSQNLDKRMTQYLNILLNMKQQQALSKQLKKMEQKSYQLLSNVSFSPSKQRSSTPQSVRNTFCRNLKKSLHKKNQNISHNDHNLSLNQQFYDLASFQQNYDKSQLMKKAQRIAKNLIKRPIKTRTKQNQKEYSAKKNIK